MSPKINSGLWGIVTCQCKLISCNKGTTLVWEIDTVGRYVGDRGAGSYMETPYLVLNFAVNIKLV